MNPVFEMAKKYYPVYWGKDRIIALRDAGKLTGEEAAEIIGGKEPEQGHDNNQ